MAKELLMPKLGLTMEEGTLIEWYIKEGDKFEAGDLIFAVETEKLTNDVEANDDGEILEILVHEGETVKVKTPVAKLVGYEEKSSEKSSEKITEESTEESKEKEAETEVEAETKTEKKKIIASPKARKLAADNKLKLEEVAEKAGKDQVSVSDIEEFLAADKSEAEETPPKKEEKAKKSADKGKSSSMRRVIGERLTESWRSPHIYLTKEIDVEALLSLKETFKNKEKHVSLNDIISLITAKAIKEYKKINSVEKGKGEFEIADDINLGLAVAVEGGLLVPVLKKADQYRLEELAAAAKDLIERTKANKLSLDELEGGTFTITNLGMFGIDQFTAILNPPQAAILAVGTIKKKLYLNEINELKEKRVINFTLGVDHRAIDGAAAAQFMQKFAEYIENPYLAF